MTREPYNMNMTLEEQVFLGGLKVYYEFTYTCSHYTLKHQHLQSTYTQNMDSISAKQEEKMMLLQISVPEESANRHYLHDYV